MRSTLGFEMYKPCSGSCTRRSAASFYARDSRVLDFGCGWGRVIRFFLKDVAPWNLVGVDIDPNAPSSAARATNRWCRFELSTSSRRHRSRARAST